MAHDAIRETLAARILKLEAAREALGDALWAFVEEVGERETMAELMEKADAAFEIADESKNS